MGQQQWAQAQCCHQDNLGSKRSEVGIWEMGDEPDALPRLRGCSSEAPVCAEPDDWVCCRPEHESTGLADMAPGSPMMEALSYVPVRFDEFSTVDAERSSSRYSKIVVHSTRARTQRRSKVWEEWLRTATAGLRVTLLTGSGFRSPRADALGLDAADFVGCKKVPATFFLDRALTKMSILFSDAGSGESEVPPIIILVENIQVICPLTDFMLLSDVIEAQLDESERARAALLQYVNEEKEPKRVCFLETSESGKDRFVQAVTALWLEKRNDHSMWF